MSSPTQLAPFGGMGIYEPFHQITPWGDAFRGEGNVQMGSSPTVHVDVLENKTEYIVGDLVESSRNDQDSPNTTDKVKRRLAQNREAARKSRMRKKAYVQQLESSRLKLAKLEQALEKSRQQGMFISSASDSFHPGFSGAGTCWSYNAGIAAFEMEYGHWVEEKHRQISDLQTALHTHIGDMELRILVDKGLSHYNHLFRMKADAANADIFYLISGKWRTSAERFFLWIGGFRPSELINVLLPQLVPLTEQQLASVNHLQQSAQQTEDALSQGIDKLQHSLAQTIATDLIGAPSYGPQVAAAIDQLEALEGLVSQADHLRRQTLQQMSRILTTRQAARCLLALGEYFHRLRALSSLWSARPRELA